jgi:enamine deaminase RidA (YjgF/YER057c/UK114 family)
MEPPPNPADSAAGDAAAATAEAAGATAPDDVARVRSGSPYEARYGFCRALRRGRRVEVAGTAPIPPPGEDLRPDAYGQMLRCGAIAREALRALGAGVEHVVRTRMFIVDPADADEVGRAHQELFGAHPPVATMVVARLLDPRWRVELEVEAELP